MARFFIFRLFSLLLVLFVVGACTNHVNYITVTDEQPTAQGTVEFDRESMALFCDDGVLKLIFSFQFNATEPGSIRIVLQKTSMFPSKADDVIANRLIDADSGTMKDQTLDVMGYQGPGTLAIETAWRDQKQGGRDTFKVDTTRTQCHKTSEGSITEMETDPDMLPIIVILAVIVVMITFGLTRRSKVKR